MIKLSPVLSEKIWGYEQWIASTHPNGLQKNFYDAIGGEYPLLIKIIQADETLSVQVHPDDEAAARLENDRGKTECWYVLDAKPDAQLVYGLKEQYSSEDLRKAIADNRLEDYLHFVPVHKGDFIFIPAGTVHAIGGGMRLLETQQSCDITYRLYDWGRPRELHVEKGLQVIKHDGSSSIGQFPGEFACQYFTLRSVHISGGFSMLVEKGEKPEDWQLLYCLDGQGTIKNSGQDNQMNLQAEDIVALAPGEKITLEGSMNIMLIRCGNHPS
ncbi:MAG: class I mannose-6-phosphate isomerase [Treponema sp.]|nr:class I mannose-6-phosphate isomerase [Treponema sp.]